MLLGTPFFSPSVVSVIIIMFYLRNLGFGQSKGAFKRVQIHKKAGFKVPWSGFCFLVVLNWFLCTEAENDDTMIFYVLVESPPIFCLPCLNV